MGSRNSRTTPPSAHDRSQPGTTAETAAAAAATRPPKRQRGGDRNREDGEEVVDIQHAHATPTTTTTTTTSATMRDDGGHDPQREAEVLHQDLADVERGLTQHRGILFSSANFRGPHSGTAVFESIGSALDGIRGRLQDLTTGGGRLSSGPAAPECGAALASTPPAGGGGGGRPSATLLSSISERLATAERAHSTRMPLGLLQTELSRREAPPGPGGGGEGGSAVNEGTDPPATTQARPPAAAVRQASRSSIASSSDETTASSEAKRRRSSTLVASRRWADAHERDAAELHEGTAATAAVANTWSPVVAQTILEREESAVSSSYVSSSSSSQQKRLDPAEEDGNGAGEEIELLLPESTRGQLDAAAAAEAAHAAGGGAGGGTGRYTYHPLTGSLRVLSQSAIPGRSPPTFVGAAAVAPPQEDLTPEPTVPEYPPIYVWGSLRFVDDDSGDSGDERYCIEGFEDGVARERHGNACDGRGGQGGRNKRHDEDDHQTSDSNTYEIFGSDVPNEEDGNEAKPISSPADGLPIPVPLPSGTRIGRSDITSVSIAPTHMAFATASGRLLICGDNSQGAVDPSQKAVMSIPRPMHMEMLAMNRILMVSCGSDHTAAITETKSVLTWGSNRFGQLGHRSVGSGTAGSGNRDMFVPPKAMHFGGHAAQVACGDGFTLVLTTRMAVYMCGREEVTGYNAMEGAAQLLASEATSMNHASLVRLPEQNPALQGLPLVYVAAGDKHAVVLTAYGTTYAWGSNNLGQCGREYPKWLKVPVPIAVPKTTKRKSPSTLRLSDPTSMANWDVWAPGDAISLADDVNIVHAACGKEHTVLVAKSGQLLVCGSNARGQLSPGGTDTPSFTSVHAVQHPISGRKFVSAEAGSRHTVMLDESGSVWQLGCGSLTEVISPLTLFPIRSIAAGGSLSLAIAKQQRAAMNNDSYPPIKRPRMPGLDALMEAIRLEHDETSTDAATLATTEELARRTEELFRSAAVMNSLFMNPKEIDDLYLKLIHGGHNHEVQQRIVTAMEKGMQQALESLTEARLMYPEAIRVFLLFLQCPLLREPIAGERNETESSTKRIQFDDRGQLFFLLCETILGMPFEGYKAFLAWTTTVYGKELFVPFLVKPLVVQLNNRMEKSKTYGVPLIAGVLRWLHSAVERSDGDLARAEDFYCSGIGELPMESLFEDLARFKKADRADRSVNFYLSAYSFLMSPSVKRNLLQVENQMGMVQAAQSAGVSFDPATREFLFKPYFVLAIDRKYLLQQTLQAVAQASPGELRKSLKVVFKGEDGVDAGGVTKEFFQLLVEKLFDVNTGMWSTRFGGGNETWFNSDCTWNDDGFYLVGVLTGLALYNSVILDVHFPPAVYRKLLGQPLGLEDMVDDDVGKGLRSLLEYEGDDVEDIFCLNFEVSWMDLGQERKIELKPGGADVPVTRENKEEYVLLYVKWLLVDSVEKQYEEFERGFMQVMEGSSLDLLRAEELELLVVGTPELDFVALEGNASYEGGFDSASPVVKNLWRFVQSAPLESQLKFLKFCTGSGKGK